VFVTSGAASKATAYVGPYAASKAALETLARAPGPHETASTNLRVNLFNPGPIRTRMRATVFPGEDPATLDTPETGRGVHRADVFRRTGTKPASSNDYKTRTLMSFPRAGLIPFHVICERSEAIHLAAKKDGLLRRKWSLAQTLCVCRRQ